LADAGANVRGGLNQVAQSMKRSMTAFGGKMLPDTEAFEDKAKRSKTITFALVATAVLLPIIIVSFIVPLYYQFSGEAERRERVQAIDVLVEKAKGSSAPADIKANWSEVLKQVGDYEARYVEDAARYGDAKIQARTQLDNLAKITRVQTSVLTQFQNQARRRITASALGVYGLNLDLGTAEYMAVNANRTELSGKPVALQYVREISGQLGLVDVAWATNQDSRWRTEGAILFGAGSVYEYSSATGRAAPLRLPPTNEAGTDKIVAGELYNNQVYLLDTSIGQIWRYPLGTGGFGRSTSYFRAAFNPLRQGIDLGIDGAIYVLLNNGSIVKYFNRQPQDFKMAGMPEPIGRAVAMAVTGNDPARGFIYVLDAQNGAVLQFDKSGQFLRQFRGPGEDFVNANDLAYDAATQTIYVITADRLYAFKTPAS
jgi:sugar lactone lactonase YvrE/nitrate reductase NapE component